MKPLVLLFALSACGPPALLECGTYDVQSVYTRDDWPNGVVGRSYAFQWEICEKTPGVYRVQGGATDLELLEDAGSLVYETAGELKVCQLPAWEYWLTLDPIDFVRFTGDAARTHWFCAEGGAPAALIAALEFTGALTSR